MILAAVVGVYLLSVGVVDLFQARLGGSVGEEELAKQAQVALSVLWAVLGASAFTIGARPPHLTGLARPASRCWPRDGQGLPGRPGRPGRRLPGAVAARPGLLLLGSAYVYGRLRPGRVATPDRGARAASRRPSTGIVRRDA